MCLWLFCSQFVFCSIKTTWNLLTRAVCLLCFVTFGWEIWTSIIKSVIHFNGRFLLNHLVNFTIYRNLNLFSSLLFHVATPETVLSSPSCPPLSPSPSWSVCVPHRGHRRHRDPGGRLLEHRADQLPAGPHVPGKPGQRLRCRLR